MALSDRNARRSDEAERARHIASTESVAFATMLLGLLNDADTVLHHLNHEAQPPTPEPAASPPHPGETSPGLAPADHGPDHADAQDGATGTQTVDVAPHIHADAAPAIEPQDARAAVDATPNAEISGTHAFASSSPPMSFDTSVDHASSLAGSSGHGGSIEPASLDLGTSFHQLTDSVTSIVDTALTAISSTIASLGATVGQLTTSVSDTIGHLTDSLTGAISGLTHDAPASGLLEPLTSAVSGLTSGVTDFSDTTHDGASLLDTAGAIPTSLLHPLPLHLGFLGQPTIDGHEPHDGAFSALGGHHF